MSTHLSVRSCYSLLNGTMTISNLVHQAKVLGFSALGLSDLRVMHGSLEFVHLCQKEGIQAIIGLEFDVLFDTNAYSVLCIARDNTGYQALMEISSKLNCNRKSIDLDVLSTYQASLFVIVYSDQSVFDQAFINDDETLIFSRMQAFKKLIPNVMLGINRQEETYYQVQNKRLKAVLKPLGIQSLATHRIFYAEADHDEHHRVLKAIGTQKLLSDKQLVLERYRYMLSKDEMAQLYEEDDLKMTDWVAAQCKVEWNQAQTRLPKFETPDKNLNSAQYLTQLCLAGLEKRFSNTPIDGSYRTRLKYELDVIVSMHYEDYFLIVWDFIRFAKTQGIYVGPGRGSAAGSLVSYCLGITHVDPIEHDLLFERFLNPERISLPDIDTDFPDNRRDEVIQYVVQKYGKDHVAHISTFGTLAAKQVLRDVGRVMEISVRELDSLSKTIPQALKITLRQAYEQSPRFKQMIASDERFQKLFRIASALEGLPRHISTHAAGVVMSSVPLDHVVPLIQIEQDMLSTQFTMEHLEALGLIKMDFLGLRNLTIIDEIVQAIQKRENIAFNILRIPLNDKKTLKLVHDVDTVGIFQLESEGMKNLLRQMKTSRFEDIVATIALFRPGPMENIPEYIQARQNPDKVVYPVEAIKPIVESTFGIMIYQEQIMQVAQRMAGFSLAKADILRKAMSKKNAGDLSKLEEAFIRGCVANGFTDDTARTVYALIFKFANYGFNKSHSVAYAMISYQMAYLKANYPDLFFVALLNSVIGSESKTYEYLQEAKAHNVKVANPSVNYSMGHYVLENGTIRFPLLIIKGVGTALNQAILTERSKGMFNDFYDFVVRMSTYRISKANFEALIDAGALDDFKLSRNTMKASLQDALAYADMVRIEHNQQISIDTSLVKPLTLVVVKDDPLDKAENERLVLGYYLSDHPLTHLKASLGLTQAIMQLGISNQNQTFIAMIKKVKTHRTKNGAMMAFIQLIDESGELDGVLMPNIYQGLEEQLKINRIVKVSGLIEKEKSCLIKKIEIIER